MKVVWVRNDQEIKSSDDFKYEEDDEGEFSLVIRDIFPEDAGIYICEAYNEHGDAHTYCRLAVHGTLSIHYLTTMYRVLSEAIYIIF